MGVSWKQIIRMLGVAASTVAFMTPPGSVVMIISTAVSSAVAALEIQRRIPRKEWTEEERKRFRETGKRPN